MMNKQKVKRIPYGISDYVKLVRQNRYYVDKTMYLPTIEDAGEYLFFIRPRRFGKSLLLSVMHCYYDVYYNDRFDELFGNTWIHENRTEQQGKYLMLALNFSAVNPSRKHLESSFLNNISTRAGSFLSRYKSLLDPEKREKLASELDNIKSAPDILYRLAELCRNSERELFIIIDEYDNFANTILASSGHSAYQDLTHGEGFFKAFFNFLKEATTGSGAPISRLFITGVSPVTLDDVTSGFNIGKNISTESDFNQLLGFTEADIAEMIGYYRDNGKMNFDTAEIMDIMSTWYNNYCFSKWADTRMYNTDMVLYFVDICIRTDRFPDNPIDDNVRIDYGKLKHLIMMDSEKGGVPNGNFNRLKQIIEKGEIHANEIIRSFPVDQLTDTQNFLSLLFYFGLLTIKGMEGGQLELQIPNQTVKQLYYGYIQSVYRETGAFHIDIYEYQQLMHAMAHKGEWRPLLEFITRHMKESLSLRDLITGEKSIQAFLNVYLGLSRFYIIQTEREFNHGFADLFMQPFAADDNAIKFAYMLEIKYIKKGDKTKNVETVAQQAVEQLNSYAMDKNLQKHLEGITLIKLVLVFKGTELVRLKEVKPE